MKSPVMLEKNVRLFFLGSGRIAVPTLETIIHCREIDVVGCATQPDKPQGRKRILTPTPVGAWAQENRVLIEKPESVNKAAFIDSLRRLHLDVILVFAFGQILKQPILGMPKHGCINIHASLLPKYRGASPVNAAIIAGDDTTGISIMLMEKGLDTGPVFERFETNIPEGSYAPDLQASLADLAAQNICESVLRIVQGKSETVVQDHEAASYAAKITKEDGHIIWTRTASEIERRIRAYTPWPGTWFKLNNNNNDRKITITAASVEEYDNQAAHPSGTILQADKHGWRIVCGKDLLSIKKLIPQGKREMTAAEFLRGNPIRSHYKD